MLKKLIAVFSAFVLMFSVTACNKEKVEPTENASSTTQTGTNKTEKNTNESSTKPTESKTTQTETPTETTEKAKRETTTVLPTITEYYKTSLYKPDSMVLYNKGKTEKVPSTQVSKVMAQINIYLNDTKLSVLKLAVDDEMIEKIKSENKAVELIYNTKQTYVLFQRTGGPDTYKFEKILIPLDGERKGYVFFCKDGVYQHGPLRSPDLRDCMEKIATFLNN